MLLQSYFSLSLSANSTIPLPSLPLQSCLLPIPLQYYLSLSICHFISSSPLFTTAILSHPYATAILSLSLFLPHHLFLFPLCHYIIISSLCHCNLISLSFCHFNPSPPLFATAILSLPDATTILSFSLLPLHLFFPRCHCYLLPMPLQSYHSLSLCHFISSSPLFATAILSPPYATVI